MKNRDDGGGEAKDNNRLESERIAIRKEKLMEFWIRQGESLEPPPSLPSFSPLLSPLPLVIICLFLGFFCLNYLAGGNECLILLLHLLLPSPRAVPRILFLLFFIYASSSSSDC